MNRYAKILMGAGLLISLAACNKRIDYETESFVVFTGSSAEVAENAGSLEIPVYAYAKNGDLAFPRTESVNTTVTFETVDGTARNGVDYTIEPASGVLTFNGSSEGSIKINVIDHPGERTGDLTFTLRLVSASDGFTLGGAHEMTVTIQDQDHPLASILGTYNATGVCLGSQMSWTATFTMDENDESIVWVDGMVPFVESYPGSASIYGVVSEDLSTITFHAPQETYLLYAEGDPFVFCLYLGDLSLSTDETDIVFTSDGQGGFTSEQGVCFVPLGAMAAYNGALIEPGTIHFSKR